MIVLIQGDLIEVPVVDYVFCSKAFYYEPLDYNKDGYSFTSKYRDMQRRILPRECLNISTGRMIGIRRTYMPLQYLLMTEDTLSLNSMNMLSLRRD